VKNRVSQNNNVAPLGIGWSNFRDRETSPGRLISKRAAYRILSSYW